MDLVDESTLPNSNPSSNFADEEEQDFNNAVELNQEGDDDTPEHLTDSIFVSQEEDGFFPNDLVSYSMMSKKNSNNYHPSLSSNAVDSCRLCGYSN